MTQENDDVTLLDFVKLLLDHKKFILIFVFISVVSAIVYSLVIPETYKATTTILPVKSFDASDSGMGMAGLGGLASIAGLSGSSSVTPDTIFMTLIESRTMAEFVVKKHSLHKYFFPEMTDQEFEATKEVVLFKSAEKFQNLIDVEQDPMRMTIAISLETRNPKLSAQLSNEVTNHLQKMIHDNVFSVSKRNRIFIEDTIKKLQSRLYYVGKAVSGAYSLKKRDVVNLVREMHDMQYSIDQIDNTGAYEQLDDPISKKVNISDIPNNVLLENVMMQYEALVQSYSLLRQQLELVRVEENKNELSFQVVDPAVVPFSRFKPRRKLIVISVFIASFIFSVILILLKELRKKIL